MIVNRVGFRNLGVRSKKKILGWLVLSINIE